MSESVFVGLCEIVATSDQIAIRRETCDIREIVQRRVAAGDGLIGMLSGSFREGFRLEGSDVDFMYWPNDHRVIMDASQPEYYNKANTTLIISDSSESPPGFTLLQPLTSSTYKKYRSAHVKINDTEYISCSIYRELTCSVVTPGSTVHGPCGSGVRGGVEYDHAWCFVCDFWPPSASSWKDRCHSWPDPKIVDDIVRNGCHFVAIGCPLGPHKDEEWRISFSQAEYKLVSSMNHCQFLTYGLLKLFLKNVKDQQSDETKTLLCSYHMKTAVFWAIQQNSVPHWSPQNLLAGFWVCFKLLLHWVYEGVCPNFFIPQNNLFMTKVHGSAQNRLFLQLHELYEKGLACLFQIPSIKSYINDILNIPNGLSICTDESIMLSEVDYVIELASECLTVVTTSGELTCLTKTITTVEHLVCSNLTHNHVVMLQKCTAFILQCTAFKLHNRYSSTGCNKQVYIANKIACHMLKLTAKFGYISDMLYIAMYYYKTQSYRKCFSVIEMTKAKLTQAHSKYWRLAHVYRKKHTEATSGQFWSTKMRQAVAVDIELHNNIYYISELITEQQSALKNRELTIHIQVPVLLHFLKFLCCRHFDAALSQKALNELQALVHHDQGHHNIDRYRDISWEILGICQQMTGNLQAALYSYQESLKQCSFNRIKTATIRRMSEVLSYNH